MTKIRYKVPKAGVSDAHLELLRPYLVGESPREDGEWDMFCPLHEDKNRSAQLNVQKGLWACQKGCGGGTVAKLIRRQSEWVPPSVARTNGRARRATGQPTEEITEGKVAGWMAALQADYALLDELTNTRGLWPNTLRRFEVGWDSDRNAYTIPVRDADGKYVNIRRYNPRPAEGRRKIWGIKGLNVPRIYPIEVLADDPDEVIICEGEWDAQITNQYGFTCVTRTASAVTWKPSWNKLFKGKVVYLCHDMDQAGQEANRKVGLALSVVAAEVKVVRLPYPLAEKHGKDLTDYWLAHEGDPDEFRRLLEEAQPFDADAAEADPEDIGPSEVSVLDSFDARRVGRPLRLTVTIKGKRDPGYSIPRKIQYACTQDAGDKCQNCPLFKEDGEAERIVPGADPLVLELLDATKLQLTPTLRRYARIPECDRLRIRVTEHQSVEILFARPSVDHVDGGNDAGDYKSIKLTSVGRHDTMPNNTVQVVGALHPDPKSQLNSFLAWDVARMETSLDRFELTRDVIEQLKRFRPRKGQRPLKKVREIADDLALNVTRIYGRPELHAAVDLVFHSVLSFDFDGKRMNKGWLELLVVGDPRTGKSEVAKLLCHHYHAGELVTCEGASLAGVLGGLQQYGSSKEWAITWGAIPLNDRRLVVLDEVGALDVDAIGQMSSIRSSGIAQLTKIQQERTYARTRLIWMGNPRNARMSNYTYGVQAIQPLIGNAEDIARFDLAMSVAEGEVPSSEINRPHRATETAYPAEACATLVRWVWSRTPEQVRWAPGAERLVLRSADALGRRYVEDFLLVQTANVREKIARIAVALAARTFSADDTYERIVVEKVHVRDAVAFIDKVYSMPGFGYAERSEELIADRRYAQQKSREIKVYLYNKPWLSKFLRSAGKFRRQDLEEIGNVDKEEANAIINTLWEARMVVKDKGDVRLTPTLHNILREVKSR